MKKLLLLVSFVASFIFAEAQTSVVIDGIKYEINQNYAVITGVDDSFLKEENKNLEIRYDINVIGQHIVKEIAKDAFKNCKNLKYVKFNHVVKIGESAFESSGLEAVSLCLSEVGSRAFADCQNLQSVCLPASVKKLGKDIFADCNIKMLTVEKCNESFLNKVDFVDFADKITVKSFFEDVLSVKTIKDVIFATRKEDLQNMIEEMPDFFNDMVKVELDYMYPDNFLNEEFPVFIAPLIEEKANDENLYEGVNPNPVWPGFELVVDKETALSVLCPSDQLCFAPGMSNVKKRGGQYMGFDDIELEIAGSGNFIFNDPTGFFNRNLEPEYSDFYNTPVISGDSRLVIGTRQDGIDDVLNQDDSFDVYSVSGHLVGRTMTVAEIDNLAKGTYVLKSENSVRKIHR